MSHWPFSRGILKNTQKLITQKLLSDRAALRVSVMQWRLEVILSTVQHNECSYGFWDSHQQEVS